ncbi:MAG: fibronectin type III domain-containing protein [Oscillospiraceae bacterium]|nr:fibronectin type III domain-containing protein [Oscillospiraceae bacterium]
MKICKRTLCLLLSLVLCFSCLSVIPAGAAQDGTFDYSLKYYSSQSDSYNTDKTLDFADSFLAQQNILYQYTLMDTILTGEVVLTIDLRSIDAICNTIDEYKDLLTLVTKFPIISSMLGDLRSLDLSTWRTGMKRGSLDATIIKEFLELARANKSLIAKLCDGTIDLGIMKNMLDLKKLLGEDGVAGKLKEMIIGLVYESGSAEAKAAYNTYKDDMDAFVYGPLLGKYADEYLPGFTMDATSTVEDLICVAFGLVVEKYVEPWVKGINVDMENSKYEDLKYLKDIVNLNGSTYDFSGISFDPNLPFLDQVNDVVGKIFTQIVPGYRWISGSYDKISENIEGALKYLGVESGLIPDAATMSFDEIVMKAIAVILRNVDLGGYETGITQCETLEDMFTVAMINSARELGVGTVYGSDAQYLTVMGDIAAWWIYNHFKVKDLSGNDLRPGSGKDVFEVANCFVNYFLFDKSLAGVLNLSVAKTDTIFTKVDKVLDYFGKTKQQGVSFESEKFLFGDGKTKGLIDSIFSLDIENIIEITAVPALRTAGDVSAVEFLYRCIQYALNNWSGTKMIPEYTTKAFTNALSNSNIAPMAAALLETLNARKDSFVPLLSFVCALLLKGDAESAGQVKITCSDVKYTGSLAKPTVKVTLGTKTLTKDTDYTYTVSGVNIGKGTVTVKGMGLYEGTATAQFAITADPVTGLTAEKADKQVTLKWNAYKDAQKYNIYLAGKIVASTEDTKITLSLPTACGEYAYSVGAVTPYGEATSAAESVTVAPAVVTGLKRTAMGAGSVKLAWNKVTGADGYAVFYYVGGKWKLADIVTSPSAYLKGLTPNTAYTFKVRAFFVQGSGQKIYGAYSAGLADKTLVAQVTGLKLVTSTSTAVKLTWTQVSGAKGYTVEKYENGAWVKAGNVTSNTAAIKSLKANSLYYFRVRAYDSNNAYGAYSSSLKLYTPVGKVTGIKQTGVSASAVRLAWSKTSGATNYVVYYSADGKTWKRAAVTDKLTYTVSGLTCGKNYKFTVRAYSSKTKLYGDVSSSILVRTLPGKVASVKCAARTATAVKLTWGKVTNATGYVVYRTTDGKNWTKVGVTSGTSIVAKGLKANTLYQFKVRAYQKVDGKTVYGAYSDGLKVRTTK